MRRRRKLSPEFVAAIGRARRLTEQTGVLHYVHSSGGPWTVTRWETVRRDEYEEPERLDVVLDRDLDRALERDE